MYNTDTFAILIVTKRLLYEGSYSVLLCLTALRLADMQRNEAETAPTAVCAQHTLPTDISPRGLISL